jgi:threonine/homoserine/homoserine lactone efflux protein
MRAALPFILVALAIFSAACVAYIAWELTSDKSKKLPDDE